MKNNKKKQLTEYQRIEFLHNKKHNLKEICDNDYLSDFEFQIILKNAL
jgi:hypothetical protein